MLPADVAHRLDTAAALLTAASRADTTDGAVVHCLLAAEHLRLAGADPSRWAPITDQAVEQVIRTALTQLATLPPEVFASNDILAAASDARTALERVHDA